MAVHPLGCRAADALDHAGKVALAVFRHTNLGVEIDQRHVFGIAQRIEEPDGRRSRQLDVFTHAAARIEQQSHVQRRRRCRLVAARKVRNRLLPAVLDDFEVVLREVADVVAAPVRHGHAHRDQVEAGPEYRLLYATFGRFNVGRGCAYLSVSSWLSVVPRMPTRNGLKPRNPVESSDRRQEYRGCRQASLQHRVLLCSNPTPDNPGGKPGV